MQRAYARHLLARPATARPTSADAPLVVAGLFSTANGIGEGARLTYRALKAAGLDPLAVDLSDKLAPVDMESDIATVPMPQAREGTLLLQLNGPEIPAALEHLDMKFGRAWYTIGYWAWELPVFPEGWEKAFPFLSEIWTVSTFVADALGRAPSPAPPIHVFGHPVAPPDELNAHRDKFGLPENAFVFLAMSDSMSSLDRKNPFGAIAAHRAAFGEDPTRILLVKTRNLERHGQAHGDLMAAIGGAGNIRLLDASLSSEGRWELLASVDALISLHRSEGFGLTIAEAMSLGKPVIATGWSGSSHLATPETAYIVGSELVPCRDRYGVYVTRDAHWADPDVDEAAQHMRAISQTPRPVATKCAAAKAHIRAVAAFDTVGAAMAQRLSRA
jgi:glycosyltransferase involved in cell wall biosynthesis